MKISHWIADLITGGALTRAVREAREASEAGAAVIYNMHQQNMRDDVVHNAMIDGIYASTGAIVDRQTAANAAAWDALRTIAAMPTPKANATVRRMARVAEEALK